ncbi:MAG: sugar nucleotide-binding protein [Planctomycetes bacterium]|nr:sugar nucleotide-binding protein [Planctomycetota bacterium]
MKIAILGMGFLGHVLFDYFSNRCNVVSADIISFSPSIKYLDAEKEVEVDNLLFDEKPNIVIDTIALSSYYLCEINKDLCMRINFQTAKNIAGSCRKINAKMIFISSSYIFDGKKGNYIESDTPDSGTAYAKSKILAEKVVLSLGDSIVLRVEPMFGFDKKASCIRVGTNTFEKPMNVAYLNLLRSPVFVCDMPKIIDMLIHLDQTGVFHVASNKKLNWYDCLYELASLENSCGNLKIVSNSDWILEPPHDTSLDASKLAKLGFEPTSFDVSLMKIKAQLV